MKEQKGTPRLANLLLRFFCRKQYREEVEGDLEENYYWRLKEEGLIRARIRYYFDVFSAIRLFTLGDIASSRMLPDMLVSFTKSSIRLFIRNRSYTILNTLGLALGMAAALYILEYVSDEKSFDQFSQSNQMYRISQDFVKNNARVYKTAVTSSQVGPAALRDLPQVEKTARLLDYTRIWNGKNIFRASHDQEKNFVEPRVYFSDPAILDLFDLTLKRGVSRLHEPNTLLLSEEMAKKYFGSVERAIGQVIDFVSVSNKPSLLVTGVYQFPEFNMQVRPAGLISYATLIDAFGEVGPHQMWGVNSSLTYVKLQQGASQSKLESDLATLLLKYNPLGTAQEANAFRTGSLLVMPVKDIHLNSDYQDEVGKVGDATTVKALMIVAILIVIIAWVNYINLATAHSLIRLKELGVRKVMGARKSEMIAQFFVEAFLMNVMALILAFCLVLLGQQFFNDQVGKGLSFVSIDWLRYGWSIGLVFSVGVLLSGIYPLTLFFSIRTVTVLQGKSKGNAGNSLRKGLIVFQFMVSTLLIVATLSIKRQLSFMTTEDMGINVERMLVLDGPTLKESNSQLKRQKTALMLNQLQQLTDIQQVSVSNNIPGKSIIQSQTLSRFSNSNSSSGQFEVVTGTHYLDILGVTFLAGHGFTNTTKHVDSLADRSIQPLTLSESASRKLGFSHPTEAIGKRVYRRFHGVEPSAAFVVGVVADYHHEALKRSIDPMIFYPGNNWDNHYLIKLETASSIRALGEIEKIYNTVYPEDPVNFYYLDDYIARQYRAEELNGKVFTAFATIAMIVACLGLFGLSSFTALQRTKEIGIRKVLGAGVKSIFYLLSKQLILLATMGFVLATPLAYYGIDFWLEGFAYRIPISPVMFLIPFLIILAMATLAISPRVLKTAFMDPVRSLRYE